MRRRGGVPQSAGEEKRRNATEGAREEGTGRASSQRPRLAMPLAAADVGYKANQPSDSSAQLGGGCALRHLCAASRPLHHRRLGSLLRGREREFRCAAKTVASRRFFKVSHDGGSSSRASSGRLSGPRLFQSRGSSQAGCSARPLRGNNLGLLQSISLAVARRRPGALYRPPVRLPNQNFASL